MESKIAEPSKQRLNRQLFLFSCFICFFCFGCLSVRTAYAVKTSCCIDLDSGKIFSDEQQVMYGDSNQFSMQQTVIKELIRPETESDLEMEQWMLKPLERRSIENYNNVDIPAEGSHPVSLDLLYEELFIEDMEPALHLESWMFDSMSRLVVLN